VDVNREGHGGGFKELDEEEVAEARRRREEFENDDTEMCALESDLLFDLSAITPDSMLLWQEGSWCHI